MAGKLTTIVSFVLLITGSTVKADEARGVVTRIQPDRGELSIQLHGRGARGVSLTFVLNKETQIQLGHDAGHVADLKPGDRVRVFYEHRDGQRIAVSVSTRGLGKLPLENLGKLLQQEPPISAPANSPAAATDPGAVTGTLQRVALSDREIVVVGPGAGGQEAETTFAVPESTAIVKDGKPLKLEDLKEGERVAVKGEKKNGKMTAQAIQVGTGPMAQEPAKNSRVEKLRRLLQMADYFLQQMSEQNGGPKP
jgi:Cu/Ag efflux protein CusF